MLYFEKNCEIICFRGLTSVSENTSKIISIGILITERQPFKRMNILSILARFISKIKKPDIFNFSSIKYFVKYFLFRKIWNVSVTYCGNYGPSNLPFCLTEHNLDHFHKEYQKYSFFLLFGKDLISRNFWQWSDGLFKKWINYAF